MDSRWSLLLLLGQSPAVSAVWQMGGAGSLGSVGAPGKMSVTCVDNTHLLGLGLPHAVLLGPSTFPCSVWL